MSGVFKNVGWKFWLALGIALLLDFGDFLLGWIPVIGTAYGILGIIILFPLIGPAAVIGGLEMVPALNVLPAFTASVIASRLAFFQKLNVFGGKNKNANEN